MADADTELMVTTIYYLREKYYRHAINTTLEGQKRYGNDPVIKLLNSLAMIFEDRLQEGMRELEFLKDRADVNIASLLVLVHSHKKCRNVDNDAIQEYEKLMRDQRKSAGERGLYYAGLVMFLLERYEKSREYIDRMLKISPQSKEGLNLRGWIEQYVNKDMNAKKAVKYFDDANELDGGKNIDSLMGKAKFLELRRSFSGALELINQTCFANPKFVPALVEKMRIHLASKDWDQTIDAAQRCLDLDSGCIEAIKHQLLHMLCQEGNYQDAADKLGDLLQIMDRHEPKNAYQFDQTSLLFSRLSGRNHSILQQISYFQERAVSLNKSNAEYVTNLGYINLYMGKNKEAIKHFRAAINLDDSIVSALQGVIYCQLNEDHLQEASTQLEFFSELQSTIGKTGEVCYLQAVLARKKGESPEKILKHLDEAIQLHFSSIQGLSLGTQYYLLLNPDFLIQIVNEYFQHAPQHPPVGPVSGQNQNPVLKRCYQILNPLTRAMPGLQMAVYLMAKVKFLSADMDSALATLTNCVENYKTFSNAYILLAQIYLHQQNFKLAEQSLEKGLSCNFEVRDHPLYHLICARILMKQKKFNEAVKALQTAIHLPGVKPNSKLESSKKKAQEISSADRVSVYLELAEAYRAMGQQHEAAKVLQDAQNDFSGTPEEVRITISNAELAIQRNDIEMALGILRTVGPDQTYFIQARQKMAEIYLNHRKDKKLYAACYRELVDKQPNSSTYLMLGDAYMNIQEPDKAMEIYEMALRANPKDLQLATKMGQALVKTHHYSKAISYYEQTLKAGQNSLRYDLAELLVKLKQYEKAEKILTQALENVDQVTELSELIDASKNFFLLSKVHSCQNRAEDNLTDLQKAHELQARVLKRVMVEQPDAVAAQKQFAARVCNEMAESCKQKKDFDQAKKLYREALVFDDSDTKAMLSLAQLYLQTGDLDSCQQQCMTLLDIESAADDAAIMMADLNFRKQEYDTAIFHAKNLLERKADNYVALSRLVDLMRRSGKLDEVAPFFTKIEETNTRAPIEAGFNFCKGLYEWYTGNTSIALKHFNRARLDNDWAQKATYNMVEVCLNPDNETVGGEVFESIDTNTDSSILAEKADSESLGLKTAARLLKELKVKGDDYRFKYMQNMTLIATKNRSNVEKALSSFAEMSQDDPENVAIIYGVSTAYMVLKQQPKARNQLKRLTKNTWSIHDAEELEKGWLLLADIYIQTQKNDLAVELLKKCIQHNKSCCKAYEYLGFLMEKEQSFKGASKNYECAWKYSNKNNPSIGYKLAFNYLKTERYVDAIEVCHHVLNNHPNFPKMKKEIMDKARLVIRT